MGEDAASCCCPISLPRQWYLALCAAEGKEPERACKGSFNVRVSPELHRQAVICAAARQMSLNSFVEQALARSVAGQMS